MELNQISWDSPRIMEDVGLRSRPDKTLQDCILLPVIRSVLLHAWNLSKPGPYVHSSLLYGSPSKNVSVAFLDDIYLYISLALSFTCVKRAWFGEFLQDGKEP